MRKVAAGGIPTNDQNEQNEGEKFTIILAR